MPQQVQLSPSAQALLESFNAECAARAQGVVEGINIARKALAQLLAAQAVQQQSGGDHGNVDGESAGPA